MLPQSRAGVERSSHRAGQASKNLTHHVHYQLFQTPHPLQWSRVGESLLGINSKSYTTQEWHSISCLSCLSSLPSPSCSHSRPPAHSRSRLDSLVSISPRCLRFICFWLRPRDHETTRPRLLTCPLDGAWSICCRSLARVNEY